MSYRDDQATLEARRDELRAELSSIETKAEALRAVVQQKEAILREVAAIEARIEHGKARRRSPLDDIRIASPCNARWDEMTGDERARFCGECTKNVYDISAMTRDEAEKLLAAHEGSLCVRLYRRADGTVLTADCSVGFRKKRVRLAVVSAVGAGALAATLAMRLGATRCYAREDYMMGAVGPRDSFVEMPLAPKPVADVVAVFRFERSGSEPAQRFVVHADRRVERLVDGTDGSKSARAAILTEDGSTSLFALAARLRPRTTGIVSAWADSAAYASIDLYGSGTAEAIEADLEALQSIGSALRVRPELR